MRSSDVLRTSAYLTMPSLRILSRPALPNRTNQLGMRAQFSGNNFPQKQVLPRMPTNQMRALPEHA